MGGAARWPARVAGIGPVRVGTVLWTTRRRFAVTVIVKASFRFVPDAEMAVVPADPIELADRSDAHGPGVHLRAARETAPLLRWVDVVLHGHAWAPPGAGGERRATQSAVRIALYRDAEPLLCKRLLVYGDRSVGGEPATFERIRLGYERALGGIGFLENPLGKGYGAHAGPLPNIVDPEDPTGTVGCLGPIPATFPPEGLRLEIPDDFDWSYFQCAPADQRLRALRADEWLELEGVSEEERLWTRLPGARAEVHIFAPARARVPKSVALVADLLQIDADRRRCSLVWRGSFPIPDERLAEELFVIGACEVGGQTVSWPASAEEVPAAMFQEPSASGAAWEEPFAAIDPQRTLVLADPEPDPSSGTAEAGGGDAQHPSGITRVLTVEQHARAQAEPDAPFVLRPAGSPASPSDESDAGVARLPGAPWSAERSPDVVQPAADLTQTIALREAPCDGRSAPAPAAPAAELAAQATEVQARQQAELDAHQAAEAEARRQRALEAQQAAAAEARRQAEAEAFAIEQALAKEATARREAQELEGKQQAAKRLGEKIYGRFRKRS
jgi:hypothetical protein